MKLQLLVLGCLVACVSVLGADSSLGRASGLSYPATSQGMKARDNDEKLVCHLESRTCYECERDDDRCGGRGWCDYDEKCINGRCCEYFGGPSCSSDQDCYSQGWW